MDALDPADEVPDRHRLRGLLHELRWRRQGREEERISAVRALDRYLRSLEALGREDPVKVKDTRRRLQRLAQGAKED